MRWTNYLQPLVAAASLMSTTGLAQAMQIEKDDSLDAFKRSHSDKHSNKDDPEPSSSLSTASTTTPQATAAALPATAAQATAALSTFNGTSTSQGDDQVYLSLSVAKKDASSSKSSTSSLSASSSNNGTSPAAGTRVVLDIGAGVIPTLLASLQNRQPQGAEGGTPTVAASGSPARASAAAAAAPAAASKAAAGAAGAAGAPGAAGVSPASRAPITGAAAAADAGAPPAGAGAGAAGAAAPAGAAAGGAPPGALAAAGAPPAGGPPPGPIDPADGGFPGGSPPTSDVDLPLTIVFLIMYATGAITHISIYRANAKRGHKFLLSDLMFDFCMVRSLTCIFRIIWVFSQLRGIILAAQIFFNGGAAVIFAVNVILVQRIVRSMHPQFGWSAGFSLITTGMAISVPIVILLQIGSLIGLFFSVGVEDRSNGFEGVLKFGSSYNLFLVVFPFLAIGISCAIPGPKPDKFGSGHLRVKTSLVMFVSALLATGAVVRTYAFFNKRLPGNDDVLYGKPIFYTTQFMLEIIVVALYALLRFDLLFHIPNGSSKPGDYSRGNTSAADAEKARLLTREEIEDRLAACQVPYQILRASYAKSSVAAPSSADQPIYAVFFPQLPEGEDQQQQREGDAASTTTALEEGMLPPRPARRVSRRQSVLEAFGSRSPAGRGSYTTYRYADSYYDERPRSPRSPDLGRGGERGPVQAPVRPRRSAASMYQTARASNRQPAPPPPPPPGGNMRGRH